MTAKNHESKLYRWFWRNLRNEAADIAKHGAASGFPKITYYRDTVKIYNRFEDEIWEMAEQDAEDCGCKSVLEFFASLQGAHHADSPHTFKNLLVWYACEKIAHEITENQYEG